MPAQDAINLADAHVYNSPADIASWPITAEISRIIMRPFTAEKAGLALSFTAENRWPNTPPPGWDGGVQYTVWVLMLIAGQWHTSGFIEMWQGRPSTGAPLLTDFAANWAYDQRWGPMDHYQPHAGEQIGVFLSAGDARGQSGPTSIRERTAVVSVTIPTGDTGTFTFPLAGTEPVPVPIPTPPAPVPPVAPDPADDQSVHDLMALLDALHHDNVAAMALARQAVNEVTALRATLEAVKFPAVPKSYTGKVPYLGSITLVPQY